MDKKKLSQIKPPDLQQLAKRDKSNWEEAMVTQVCIHLQVPGNTRSEMRSWQQSQNGEKSLTFEAFQAILPEFPVLFRSSLIANLPKHMPVSRIFGGLASTRVYKEWVEVREEAAHTGYTGAFVFRWPNLSRRATAPDALVLHNWLVEGMTATRLLFTDKDGQQVWMQKLSDLVKEIASAGWQ